MSIEVQYGLIAHFFHYRWEEISLLPVSKYYMILEQASNIASLHAGGKFETETRNDKDKQFRKEIADMKAFQSVQGK